MNQYTKALVDLINENPVASSIYYGVSVFAFIIGIAIIS